MTSYETLFTVLIADSYLHVTTSCITGIYIIVMNLDKLELVCPDKLTFNVIHGTNLIMTAFTCFIVSQNFVAKSVMS